MFADSVFRVDGAGIMKALSAITVNVYFEATATHPPLGLFTDVTGATTKTNPFNTAAGGAIEFCAEEGYAYDITISDTQARIATKTIHWHPARMPKVGDQRIATHNEADSSDGQWLVANGRAISRSTYSVYFGLVGTAWGIGDGSTTFNIPNLGTRALVGASPSPDSGLSTTTIGDKWGAEAVALSTAQLPAHGHGVTDPTHSHLVDGNAAGAGSETAWVPGVQFQAGVGPQAPMGTAMSQSTGITIQNTGSGSAHDNWNPSAGVKMLVKVK